MIITKIFDEEAKKVYRENNLSLYSDLSVIFTHHRPSCDENRFTNGRTSQQKDEFKKEVP